MNPQYSCRRPDTPDLQQAYYRFRWRHLRQPWGQPPDETSSADELASEHLVILDDASEIVACGRLLRLDNGHGQLRSMAVAENLRQLGLGRQLVQTLESWACGLGLKHLRVHARQPAEEFYRAMGYRSTGPGEMLFGEIPHVWMEKDLDCADFSRFGLQRRSATTDDGPAVATLVFKVLAGYGMAPEPDGIDRDLEDLPAAYAGGFFDLLHNEAGALIATIGVLPLQAGRGELRRMYLDPDMKGRGLGRALLGHALVWAREHGYTELELETASSLSEALALYRWAGFQPIADPHCEARRCDLRMRLQL